MYSYPGRRLIRRKSESLQQRSRYDGRPQQPSHSIQEVRGTSEDTAYVLPSEGVESKDTGFLLRDVKIPSEGEPDISLISHLVHIVVGVWKLFKDIPLTARIICIVLTIVALVMVSLLVNLMMQIV